MDERETEKGGMRQTSGGGEVLFGRNPVIEALKAGRRRLMALYYESGRGDVGPLQETIALALERQVATIARSGEQLSVLCRSDRHQGVAVRAGALPLASLQEVLAACRDRAGLLLILDGILDPQNLGALIRTALCAGVDGVMLTRDRSAPLSAAVSRASAGALEHIRVARVTNLVRAMTTIKASGFWIAGLDRRGGRSLFESDLTGALAIAVGGEDKGLRPLVRQNCDYLLAIPQAGAFNSLNASVAGAVSLYEAFRQRTFKRQGLDRHEYRK